MPRPSRPPLCNLKKERRLAEWPCPGPSFRGRDFPRRPDQRNRQRSHRQDDGVQRKAKGEVGREPIGPRSVDRQVGLVADGGGLAGAGPENHAGDEGFGIDPRSRGGGDGDGQERRGRGVVARQMGAQAGRRHDGRWRARAPPSRISRRKARAYTSEAPVFGMAAPGAMVATMTRSTSSRGSRQASRRCRQPVIASRDADVGAQTMMSARPVMAATIRPGKNHRAVPAFRVS